MVNDMKKKHKKLEYKELSSKVVELISSEELISLFNLKSQIERRERKAHTYDQMLKHK